VPTHRSPTPFSSVARERRDKCDRCAGTIRTVAQEIASTSRTGRVNFSRIARPARVARRDASSRHDVYPSVPIASIIPPIPRPPSGSQSSELAASPCGGLPCATVQHAAVGQVGSATVGVNSRRIARRACMALRRRRPSKSCIHNRTPADSCIRPCANVPVEQTMRSPSRRPTARRGCCLPSPGARSLEFRCQQREPNFHRPLTSSAPQRPSPSGETSTATRSASHSYPSVEQLPRARSPYVNRITLVLPRRSVRPSSGPTPRHVIVTRILQLEYPPAGRASRHSARLRRRPVRRHCCK